MSASNAINDLEEIKKTAGDCKDDEEGEEEGNGIQVRNKHLDKLEDDVLYHLALSTKANDLFAMFNDVKFVCLGGSPRRMEEFAFYMWQQLKHDIPAGQTLENIARATDRYAMYKVGPVLSLSHGMGVPSISILLHEVMKLLHYAKCTDVAFFRMGTSGGLGLKPGTVVITEEVLDGMFQPHFEIQILGEIVRRPVNLDDGLIKALLLCSRPDDDFDVVTGKTMCTSDFYEAQARLDGFICDFSEEEKVEFLKKAHSRGIRNIEMESICFAAMCRQANVRGAVVCAALVDRLRSDQIDAAPDQVKIWDKRPAVLIARYICKKMGIVN